MLRTIGAPRPLSAASDPLLVDTPSGFAGSVAPRTCGVLGRAAAYWLGAAAASDSSNSGVWLSLAWWVTFEKSGTGTSLLVRA